MMGEEEGQWGRTGIMTLGEGYAGQRGVFGGSVKRLLLAPSDTFLSCCYFLLSTEHRQLLQDYEGLWPPTFLENKSQTMEERSEK